MSALERLLTRLQAAVACCHRKRQDAMHERPVVSTCTHEHEACSDAGAAFAMPHVRSVMHCWTRGCSSAWGRGSSSLVSAHYILLRHLESKSAGGGQCIWPLDPLIVVSQSRSASARRSLQYGWCSTRSMAKPASAVAAPPPLPADQPWSTLSPDLWAAIARCALAADGDTVEAWCRLTLVCRTFRSAIAGERTFHLDGHSYCQMKDMRNVFK